MTEPDTRRLERTIGGVLRAGAVTSTAVLAGGLVWKIAAPASARADFLLTAGLIILMATPVARVVASVVEYVVDGDWPFAGITFAVLVVLLGSFVYALR